MSNDALSDAIKEAYASVPTDQFILHTLEINHPAVSSFRDKLDLCFVVDSTGSMGGIIDDVKDNIAGLIAGLAPTFSNIRYALVDFKDEGQTYIRTGSTFVDLATFESQLELIVPSGGGDGPENGAGAVVMGCEELDWRTSRDVGRAMVLFTDIGSHQRGATREEAISSLVLRDIIFSYFGPAVDINSGQLGYEPIAAATGGLEVSSENFLADLIEAITLSSELEGSELFIVQDKRAWDLTLEDGRTVNFEPVGFRFRLPGAGENGLQELSIAIDNVDRRLSDFIDLVKDFNTPVTLTYRPYLNTDTSGPQMIPPLKLYLRDVVVTPFEVNGRAAFADIINKKFPAELYTRTRFPSLGD